jgi:hypothetical protein
MIPREQREMVVSIFIKYCEERCAPGGMEHAEGAVLRKAWEFLPCDLTARKHDKWGSSPRDFPLPFRGQDGLDAVLQHLAVLRASGE